MKFYDFFGCKPCAYIPDQLLRVMKLIVILMTSVLLQVSAASTAQRITLKVSGSKLKTIFSEIKKQTGYMVLYKTDQLRDAKPVDVYLDNVPLDEGMKEILKGQKLSFIIKDQSIIIREKEKSVLEDIIDSIKGINIKGKVVDEKGEALPGASIRVKNSTLGTLANAEGDFTLEDLDENAVLQISFIGYVSRELKASADLGKIVMSLSNARLQEVVVMGYSSRQKAEITGSIVSLQAKDIENSSVQNPLQSLQGKVPGLRITQGSGQPGGERMGVTMRGPTSFASGSPNTPLVLINGVIGDINALDPSFIESVTVLKDASAAIYGARGANGVILVTTKTGADDSRLSIDFNSSYINQSDINQPERVWNSVDFMNMKKQGDCQWRRRRNHVRSKYD